MGAGPASPPPGVRLRLRRTAVPAFRYVQDRFIFSLIVAVTCIACLFRYIRTHAACLRFRPPLFRNSTTPVADGPSATCFGSSADTPFPKHIALAGALTAQSHTGDLCNASSYSQSLVTSREQHLARLIAAARAFGAEHVSLYDPRGQLLLPTAARLYHERPALGEKRGRVGTSTGGAEERQDAAECVCGEGERTLVQELGVSATVVELRVAGARALVFAARKLARMSPRDRRRAGFGGGDGLIDGSGEEWEHAVVGAQERRSEVVEGSCGEPSGTRVDEVVRWLDTNPCGHMLPSEPDVLVVFIDPRTGLRSLCGFPVWQMRLTQICFVHERVEAFSNEDLYRAATVAASAPKRFGK